MLIIISFFHKYNKNILIDNISVTILEDYNIIIEDKYGSVVGLSLNVFSIQASAGVASSRMGEHPGF